MENKGKGGGKGRDINGDEEGMIKERRGEH